MPRAVGAMTATTEHHTLAWSASLGTPPPGLVQGKGSIICIEWEGSADET